MTPTTQHAGTDPSTDPSTDPRACSRPGSVRSAECDPSRTLPRTRLRTPLRTLARLVAGTAAAALLLACQSGDGGDRGGDGGGDSKEPSASEREDAFLDFAACMRENGVPMDDPKPGAGGGLLINGKEVDPETARAAEEKCHHLIEDVLPDADEMKVDPKQKEAMLAQAACMRERGWDIPDPQFDGGRVQAQLGDGIDPSDPQFQKDHAECADESGLEAPRLEAGR